MKKYILASLLIVGNSIKAEIDEQVSSVVTVEEEARKKFVDLHGEEIVQKIEKLQQKHNKEQEEIYKKRVEEGIKEEFEFLYQVANVTLESKMFKNNPEIQEAFKEAQEEGKNQEEAAQIIMNMFHDLIKQNCGPSDLRCIENQGHELQKKSKWAQLFEKITDEERKILFSKELNINK